MFYFCVILRVFVEKYKEDVTSEEYRQEVLRRTSTEVFEYDESKKPAGEAVNESFRKLTVDWAAPPTAGSQQTLTLCTSVVLN